MHLLYRYTSVVFNGASVEPKGSVSDSQGFRRWLVIGGTGLPSVGIAGVQTPPPVNIRNFLKVCVSTRNLLLLIKY